MTLFQNWRRLGQMFRDFNMLSPRIQDSINKSPYISRDLSWLNFNRRVLGQALKQRLTLFEKLKFQAITASNLDEFFMIRVGSLYNYLDYGKERIDYSGLREKTFRLTLFNDVHRFCAQQEEVYFKELSPAFTDNGFNIVGMGDLSEPEREKAQQYFKKTIYPMLTPMLLDVYHTFPVVNNKALTFGVVTEAKDDDKNPKRLSFVQIPQNLPRFFEIDRGNLILFLPVEEIVRWQMDKLFKNVKILSANLFRITRNGDVTIEESDDIEADFVEEVRRKLSYRRTGRVVRIEVEDNYSSYMMKIMKQRWEIDADNIFVTKALIDYTALWQIVKHPEFKDLVPPPIHPVLPISAGHGLEGNLFELLKKRDVLLHHPYNSMDPVITLLEQAAEDPNVLSIKLTIYRLAKDSRITNALLRAAEKGKFVSALFEVKARFDEENNINEAKRLQKAGCFVIYGISSLKTHTKLMLIVRKEDERVTRYVHMSSGNYNEVTSRMYTDISLLTSDDTYANDVSEFFNAITGHSQPDKYSYLITAPDEMRNSLVALIRQEAQNASEGKPARIVIKVNSLEDRTIIDELYAASASGVKISLIIRGICCLRPMRKNLSDNITVRSLVGDLLEHTRIYYFHNGGDPKLFGGSADMMNRSFDRRIESLFLIADPALKQEVIHILKMNLLDNSNAWELQEDGNYLQVMPNQGEAEINVHQLFYHTTEKDIQKSGPL